MKKILNVFLAVLLMSFTFGNVARAAEPQADNYEAVMARVDAANTQIDLKIATAVAAGDRVVADYELKISKLNADDLAIAELQTAKDTEINAIIANLVADTNKISQDTQDFGTRFGYSVICSYVEVVIGGQSVLIDPLRVPSD